MIEERLTKLGVERTGVPPIWAHHGVHGRAASVGARVLHVPVNMSTDRAIVIFPILYNFFFRHRSPLQRIPTC